MQHMTADEAPEGCSWVPTGLQLFLREGHDSAGLAPTFMALSCPMMLCR